MKAENTGEKEPKARWILAIIGILALGGGYGIALSVKSPILALTLFFVAVILVIIATYTLFIGGSITFLKMRKKNKRYYYQSKHFVTVSGMLFRMKQNAVGLANIALLATMTMVIVVSTVALYVGQKDIASKAYPREYKVTSGFKREKLMGAFHELTDKYNVEMANEVSYEISLSYSAYRKNETKFVSGDVTYTGNNTYITVMTFAEYNQVSNETLALKEDEILLYDYAGRYNANSITLESNSYGVKILDN
jgi:putative ABC transport system permease protein